MRIFLFPLLFVLLLSGSAYGQNELDVLPISGRNELFHTFLMDRGAEIWDARRDSVASALRSASAVLDRQAELKEAYLGLLGDLPDKTPLNAEIIDTVDGDGYVIERLHYQSVPNHHVTANFYIPTTGTGPYPAVLVLCGHYPVGKVINIHQYLGALFAKNGIAALIVDPFSQGERAQIQDPNTDRLLFAGQSGTAAHSRLDVGAVLSGTSVVSWALWDNHRAMDYLYSRTDLIDTSRVGCTGSSGGGSQATYLCAFDERIKVAAVNSFLMNEETLYGTIGPQTASQNLSYEGAHSIDHPDYVTMFAPKPYLILAATQDFFDVTATRATFAEVQEIYDTLGVSDRVRYFEEDAAHGYLQPRREEGVRWFKKWFYDDDSPVEEPDLPVLGSLELQVTESGQVVEEFADEKTVTDLNVELSESLETARTNFWMQNSTDSCLNKVQELIRWEEYDAVSVQEGDVIDRGTYTITKMEINSGDHITVPGLLFVPKNLSGTAPGVLYVDGRGKIIDAGEGGVLEKFFVDSGKVVLTIDVRGFGETTDNPSKNESKHGNKEHRNAVIGAYIGKTLIGQRVEDIMKGLDVLLDRSDVDPADVTLIGVDRSGPVVLHAAALDDRVVKTEIRNSFESWLPIVATPTELHNMTHVVPFALKYYDLPDLANTLGSSVSYFDEPYVVSSVAEVGNPDLGYLGQIYPNPVRGTADIPYRIISGGNVALELYDQDGRLIKQYRQGQLPAGEYTTRIDLDEIPSGQYYYKLRLEGRSVGNQKMLKIE